MENKKKDTKMQTGLFELPSKVDRALNNEIQLTPRIGQLPFAKSLWKSILQKNIRRSRQMETVRTAVAYMEVDFNDFMRRLPVVIIEDALLHPDFDELIQIMIRASKKGYQPTEGELDFLVKMIYETAGVEFRDRRPYKRGKLVGKIEGEISDKAWEEMDDKQTELCRSLLIRAKYGGMSWDMMCLKKSAYTWSKRFRHEEGWLERLQDMHYFSREPAPKFKDVGVAKRTDILLEAIDFHCSPIAKILAKKDEFISDLNSLQGLEEGDEDIKEEGKLMDAVGFAGHLIWRFRSSVNHKKCFRSNEAFNPWPAFKSQSMEKRQFEIFEKWKPELDSISKWWLRTMLKNDSK